MTDVNLTRSQTVRLRVAAAAIQMSLGLAVYQFPQEFSPAAQHPLRPFVPYMTVALMSAGVGLLLWRRPLRTLWDKLGASLLALPIGMLTVWTAASRGWSGLVMYGTITLALVLAPWLDHRLVRLRRDLFSLTMAFVVGTTGIMLLAWPAAFATHLYAPIAPIAPWLGILGVAGAVAAVLPLAQRPLLLSGQLLATVALPAVLVYNWVRVGALSGVTGWGIFAIAIMVHERIVQRVQARAAQAASDRTHPVPLANVERTLERWTWLLAVLVVATITLGGEAAFSRPSVAHLFVFAVSGYNAVVYRFLPRLGTPAQRVHAHLLFLTVLGGLLHVSGGPAGHGYLTLLVVVPPLATGVFNVTAGRRYLGLALAVVVGSEGIGWWLAGGQETMAFGGATAMQVILLMVAASVGMHSAHEAERQRRQLETAIESLHHSAAERERLVAIMEATPDLVGMADTDGQLIYVNRAGRAMLGLPEGGDVAGRAIGLDHPSWAWRIIQDEAWPEAARAGVWRGETAIVTNTGEEIPVLQTIIAHRSADGEIAYYSTIMRDITEQKQLEARLRHLAQHDDLTNLPNRRRFHEELASRLTEAHERGTVGSVLLLDLDGFKDVNDTFGHGAGDRLLSSLALLLQEHVRETELVARLGGDEFALLLPDASAGEAEDIAQRIITALTEHTLLLDGRPVRAMASIGIACYPLHGTTIDEVIANADAAMYEAKAKGRNAWATYRPSEDGKALADERLMWDRRIRRALAEDRFVLECQPIFALEDGQVCQVELLLRLLGERGELIPPTKFIGIAETQGLIHAIDRWVVQRAIQLIAQRQAGVPGVVVAVNLSAKAFSDPDLLPIIVAEFDRSGADPRHIVFEITETAVIADIRQARNFIEELSDLGCRFSIDDFGTGFSSYTVLRQLPVHFLKLDRSLVSNVATDPVDRAFVAAMTDIAHQLGQQVIAEGVSDAETLAQLQALGIDGAQGFYLGRPEPIVDGACFARVMELANS